MDIDFITDLTSDFEISLGENPQGVFGNRALLNRFEITFLTKVRRFLSNNQIVTDNYGGDADNFINKPQVLNDLQSIATGMSVAVDKTVESMQGDEPIGVPNTERLSGAEVVDVSVINGVVNARVRVVPVEVESYSDLIFNLPIIKRN